MELDTTHLILRGLGVLGVLEGWSDSEIKTRHASAFKDCAGRTLPLEDASRGDVFHPSCQQGGGTGFLSALKLAAPPPVLAPSRQVHLLLVGFLLSQCGKANVQPQSAARSSPCLVTSVHMSL